MPDIQYVYVYPLYITQHDYFFPDLEAISIHEIHGNVDLTAFARKTPGRECEGQNCMDHCVSVTRVETDP